MQNTSVFDDTTQSNMSSEENKTEIALYLGLDIHKSRGSWLHRGTEAHTGVLLPLQVGIL